MADNSVTISNLPALVTAAPDDVIIMNDTSENITKKANINKAIDFNNRHALDIQIWTPTAGLTVDSGYIGGRIEAAGNIVVARITFYNVQVSNATSDWVRMVWTTNSAVMSNGCGGTETLVVRGSGFGMFLDHNNPFAGAFPIFRNNELHICTHAVHSESEATPYATYSDLGVAPGGSVSLNGNVYLIGIVSNSNVSE